MKKIDSKINTKKLAAYSAVAGAFILAGNSANSQNVINYVDVDPDETYNTGDVFELDLNDDGDNDLIIANTGTYFSTSFFSVSSGGDTIFFPGFVQLQDILATPENGALLGSSGSGGYSYPLALDAGDAIDDGENFLDGSSQSMVYSQLWKVEIGGSLISYQIFSDGYWFGGQNDKYLGIKFEIDGNDHYGWVRLDVSDDNTEFTVKDYAYNTVAELGLEAGQDELVSIKNVISSDIITTYSFAKNIHISVNNLNAENATVQILNSLGEEVYADQLNQNGMDINLTIAAQGIYTVHIIADGAIFTKNVVLN